MSDYSAIGKEICDGLITPMTTPLSRDTCPICLNAYIQGLQEAPADLQGRIVQTHCQHIFHHACLHTWLSTGKTSCPMCRIKLCTFPDLVDSRDALYDLTDDSDPFETMQLPMPWEEPPHDQQRGDLAVVETTPWLEENRILRTLEHSGRVQRQRLMLIYELSTLVQEEEQHTSEELQYHRRVQGGETERADWHRRDRLQSLRMQQDLIMPEFWALDQSVRELILEEHQLRDVYDLEDLVTTSPPPY